MIQKLQIMRNGIQRSRLTALKRRQNVKMPKTGPMIRAYRLIVLPDEERRIIIPTCVRVCHCSGGNKRTVQRMTNIPVRFWKICHSDPGVCLFSSMRRQVRGLPWLPGVGVEFQQVFFFFRVVALRFHSHSSFFSFLFLHLTCSGCV